MDILDKVLDFFSKNGRFGQDLHSNQKKFFLAIDDDDITRAHIINLLREFYGEQLKEFDSREVNLKAREDELKKYKSRLDISEFEAEQQLKRQQIEFKTVKDTLDAAIRHETHEETRILMQAAQENYTLREQIKFFKQENDRLTEMHKNMSDSMADTLRAAFNRPNNINIQKGIKSDV